MKKIASVFLIVTLTLGLMVGMTGCGDGESDKTKVGFIFLGSIEDGGFTQAHYEGVQELEAEMGDEIEVLYKESVSDTDGQAINTAIQQLLDEGCEIVFGCSFGYMDYLEQYSKDYPDKYFLHFSGIKSNETNYDNYFGAMEEARYLSGMIAGSQTESNKLGYVAAFDVPEVVIGINAFTLGAQSVNPDVEVQVIFINNWYEPTKEKQAAEELIAAGCDVITQHADTTGPQVAAEENGVYAIGYNYDNKGSAAPGAYLTAPIWNHDVYYTQVVQAIIDGTFVPSAYYGNMQDGYVGLGEMTDLVPQETQDLVNAKAEEMKAGNFAPYSGEIVFTDGTVFCKEGQTLTRAEIWKMPAGSLVEGVTSKVNE